MSNDQTESSRSERDLHLTRRSFLVGTTALGAATYLLGGSFATKTGHVYRDPAIKAPDKRDPVSIPETRGSRHWLGPELWGNRLQDWQVNDGRLECLRGQADYELRTVGLLTHELVTSNQPGHLRVQTGAIDGGFAGFLLGVGNGELDYQAAALAQHSSGTGGGFLCTYETDGQARFREHTDEEHPIAYEELSPDTLITSTSSADPSLTDGVQLTLDLLPEDENRFSVVVKAIDPESGDLLSGAVRESVPEGELLGGISLVSSPYPGQDGTRWWLDQLETVGEKIATVPEQTFGPIAGTLYSVNESVVS